MNHWTQLSIEYANQQSYLDDLFRVYPTIPEGIRDIDEERWKGIERAFKTRNNQELLVNLLKLKLFPLKDSYIAYLKRDKGAAMRNPETVNRLCGRLYEMGLKEMYLASSKPKETNRQIGPLFRRWIKSGSLGAPLVELSQFLNSENNAILDASDAEMLSFARTNLNYRLDKGLDFVARFNKRFVIGEAKFLTDFGGHQNAQFKDGIALLHLRNIRAIPAAILDGVLYIKGRNKMHRAILGRLRNKNIMSALVLREFLYQV